MFVISDFSDEVANKTLLERPSALFVARAPSHVRARVESATDSELDSDSGYSSPMHRKHRASSTHCSVATASIQCHAPSSLQQPWLHSGLYAKAVLHGNIKPNASANSNSLPQRAGVSGDALNVAQANAHTQSSSAQSTHVSSSDNRVARADQSEKSRDGETSAAQSHDAKPKRKRSRRRKKGSEAGALSDSGMDLVRAHSSSNVSRTSTVDNDFLHFEDENEFPNLLNAVGGLQGDAQQMGAVSISYCDILKGQAIKVRQLFVHK